MLRGRMSVPRVLILAAALAPAQHAATRWRFTLFALLAHLTLASLLQLWKFALQNALGCLLPISVPVPLLLLHLLLALLAFQLVLPILPLALLPLALLARVFLALLRILALLPLAALILCTLAVAPVLGAAPAVVHA